MLFKMGRTNIQGEGDSVQHAKETHGNSLFVERINKLGFTPREKVALMGSHTLGFIGEDKKGHHSRWCLNPFVFDNTYFQDLLMGDRTRYAKLQEDL